MEVPDQRLTSATFADLALPLLDPLFNFAHWLTQDATEAEDLVQETYVKALRGFSGFQMGTNFRAWIFRILRNAFLNSRSGLKTIALDENVEEPVSGAPSPEAVLLAEANREAVREAMAMLAVGHREILLLCEVEEMSYEEIAQVLAIPIGTVMSRLYRARKALRAVLMGKVQGASHGL